MIKNIIFDFGGVIINIDYQRIVNAFRGLGIADFDRVFSQAQQSELMDNLETGKITPEEFHNAIRELAGKDIADSCIDDAMNAIIMELPPLHVELLQKIKKHYNLYLFSNTNLINYNYYCPLLKKQFGFDIFRELFQKAYFSHEIGMRKPDVTSYQCILEDSELRPEETLFVDDSIQNIEGANKAGLRTVWLRKDMDIAELFDEQSYLREGGC